MSSLSNPLFSFSFSIAIYILLIIYLNVLMIKLLSAFNAEYYLRVKDRVTKTLVFVSAMELKNVVKGLASNFCQIFWYLFDDLPISLDYFVIAYKNLISGLWSVTHYLRRYLINALCTMKVNHLINFLNIFRWRQKLLAFLY